MHISAQLEADSSVPEVKKSLIWCSLCNTWKWKWNGYTGNTCMALLCAALYHLGLRSKPFVFHYILYFPVPAATLSHFVHLVKVSRLALP